MPEIWPHGAALSMAQPCARRGLFMALPCSGLCLVQGEAFLWRSREVHSGSWVLLGQGEGPLAVLWSMNGWKFRTKAS